MSSQMVTAWVVVRNITSSADELRFQQFTLRHVRQGVASDLLRKGRELFPNAVFWGDWLYERRYSAIPKLAEDITGFGRIPFDTEDTLLLLRLFNVGDIVFAAHALEDQDGQSWLQKPHRTFADVASRHHYRIEQDDCSRFDAFSAEIGPRLAFRETPQELWLEVAKRFFLYGGAKEVNRRHGLLDRIVDYAISLEACLLIEADFVGRHVRERAAALLGERTLSRLVRDYYDLRSKIVHGASLDRASEKTLDRLQEFEDLVRRVMVSLIRSVPKDESDRKAFLRQLFSMSTEEISSNYHDRIKALGQECESLIRRKLAAAPDNPARRP